MPIYARTSGGVYKAVSKILTADGSEIGKVVDSTGRIIYEASRLITVTGVPPISFTKSIGEPLISWSMLGNAQQTGTPAPDAPIMPEFVGVSMGNLFDVSTVEKGRIVNGVVAYGSQTSSLTIEGESVYFTTTAANRGVCSGFFEIPEGTETISFNFTSNEPLGVRFVFYDDTKTWLNQDYIPTLSNIPPATANVPSGAKYVRLSFTGHMVGGYSYVMSNIMLNLGSTALPYEPYGYKIPFNNHGDNLAPPINEWVDGYISGTTGSIVIQSATYIEKSSEYIEIPNNASIVAFSGEDGSFEVGSSGAWRAIGFYDSNKTFVSRLGGSGSNAMVVSVPESTKFMRVTCRTYGSDKEYMLNTGSIAKPYSPYFSETVPVYLGQTQTVRRVKKLVFDGSESWNRSTSGNNTRVYTPQRPECLSLSPAVCTHFNYNVANVGYPRVGEFVINSSKAIIFGVDRNTFADVDVWKSYLSAQYAAGTPVTVWYVLATPETGIVNEPLAKIGDYADELHSADAGVTIPTAKGNNTLTVDTDLPPSSMTIVYKRR